MQTPEVPPTINRADSNQITAAPLTPEGSPKNSRGSQTRGLQGKGFRMQTPEVPPTINRADSNQITAAPLTPEGSPKNSRGSQTRGSQYKGFSNPTPEGRTQSTETAAPLPITATR